MSQADSKWVVLASQPGAKMVLPNGRTPEQIAAMIAELLNLEGTVQVTLVREDAIKDAFNVVEYELYLQENSPSKRALYLKRQGWLEEDIARELGGIHMNTLSKLLTKAEADEQRNEE